MKRYLLFALLSVLFMLQCSSPNNEMAATEVKGTALPRVLFITSGISGNDTQLPTGIVIAVQSLNKRGAVVRLESREILFDLKKLCEFNIIILSTFPGYHDADRKYSLTYMSDFELDNLERFVRRGGVIVAGDNLGRNFPDGTDRIVAYGSLTPENWILSDCYGLGLSEKNMTGYDSQGEIEGYSEWDLNNASLRGDYAELWTLVSDSIYSDEVEVLGYWKDGNDSLPAIVKNTYNEGLAFLLASSAFLHPANDGGHWSMEQIESFYDYVLDEYNRQNGLAVSLNPWPSGYKQAFCLTLNSSGTLVQYERIFSALQNEGVEPTVFVNALVDEDVKAFLRSRESDLQSSGYAYLNYKGREYPRSLNDVLMNESQWDIDFKGFRFPYTNLSYWGLMALNERDYLFESSIGANNLDFIHGSVHPYNIVISNNSYFVSTDILEIAPSYHDDYYFLKDLSKPGEPDPLSLDKQLMIYSKYLENYWNYAVKPYNGLMVFLGHPRYTGYNEETIVPLLRLVDLVKNDDAWVTTIEEVAEFKKNLAELRFFVEKDNKNHYIRVVAEDNAEAHQVCLNVAGIVEEATASSGEVIIKEKADSTQIIFNAFNGQIIRIYQE